MTARTGLIKLYTGNLVDSSIKLTRLLIDSTVVWNPKKVLHLIAFSILSFTSGYD